MKKRKMFPANLPRRACRRLPLYCRLRACWNKAGRVHHIRFPGSFRARFFMGEELVPAGKTIWRDKKEPPGYLNRGVHLDVCIITPHCIIYCSGQAHCNNCRDLCRLPFPPGRSSYINRKETHRYSRLIRLRFTFAALHRFTTLRQRPNFQTKQHLTPCLIRGRIRPAIRLYRLPDSYVTQPSWP